MPDRRYAPRENVPVNRNVYGWDDGVEYISPESLDSSPGPSSRRSRRDRSPPPPYSSGTTRHKAERYIPPTPPQDSDRPPRRSHRRNPSPSRSRSPSPPRRRHTHRSPSPRRLDGRPPLTTSKTTPDFSQSSDRDRPSRHRSTRHHHRSSPSPSPPPLPSRRRTEPPARSNTTKANKPSRPIFGAVARSKTAKEFTSFVSSPRLQQAATAALQAGGATAFKLRREKGPWIGGKGAKVATAAIGAAAMSGFAGGKDKDGRRDGGGGGMPGGMPGGMGAVGGMVMGALADQFSKKGRK